MKKLLDHIRITPAENGGHTVAHVFKRAPASRKGAALGGLSFEAPPAEEHVFGTNEKRQMMQHVAGALGIQAPQIQEK